MIRNFSLLKQVILPVFALLSLQCVELPPSPVAPTLDVQGSIPLLDRIFFVESWLSDTSITRQPDGGLLYESSQNFDPLSIDTILVEPEASSQQTTLGTFEVQTPDIPPVSLSVPGIPEGDVIVPPGTFTIPQRAIGPLASFEYIEFESGTMSISIQNTLPIPIDFPQPLVLKNNVTSGPVDTGIVATFNFSQIDSGGSQIQVADLAGITMQSALQIPSMDVSTPGSGGNTVTVESDDGLLIQITIDNAEVRAAKAEIPSQPVLSFTDSTFVVDDSLTIELAWFSGGSFSVEVENNIDVDVGMVVRFSQLQDRVTSVPFEINHQFAGVETRSFPVNMSGLKFESLIDSIGTRATFSVGIATIGNTDSTREVRATDFVRVSIVPGPPITVERVTGRVRPTLLQVNTGSPGFGLGETAEKFEGTFTFDSLEIALQVSTSLGFPIDYDIQFIGMDRRSSPPKIDSLTIPPPLGLSQRRIFPATFSTTSIVLDNTAGLNSFFSKFAPHLPDTFIIRGTMLINPPDVYPTPEGKQTIYDTTKIRSTVDMSFPIQVGITNASVRDTVPLNIRDKFPKSFAASTKSGTLYFEIENRLPFALSFQSALLGNGPGGPRDTLVMIPSDGPRFIDPASVDASGSATAPTISRFAITMNESEAQHFENSEVLWIELMLETPNSGAVVKLKDTDYVKVRASGNLVYQVNKP